MYRAHRQVERYPVDGYQASEAACDIAGGQQTGWHTCFLAGLAGVVVYRGGVSFQGTADAPRQVRHCAGSPARPLGMTATKIMMLRPKLKCQCVAKSPNRSEEPTSELQSLMRISYAVFCLKQKRPNKTA